MNMLRTNPYIGPRTFMKEEGHLFFGREREARDLLSLVVSHRLVLFYAQSGAGKSSIINTRLIPSLEERGFETFPVGRVSGDLAPEGVDSNVYIYNLMRKLIQHEEDANVLAGLSLSQFLASLNSDEKGYFYDSQLSHNRPEDYPQWRHALIIDQFEELFSTHPEAWKKREDFFCQLSDAMQDDPYLWVILVMREDYIASLDPYAHLLPDGLKVRYYMQRLGREAALKAIKNPVAELRPYAPNVAEKLVDDLCSIKVQNPDGSPGVQPGQYVEPVQLQVVCYSLWENLEEGTEITEDDVRKVGDVDKALGRYYAGRVKSVAANEKLKVTQGAIRRWFETNLITEGGIRNMVLQEPNKKSGGLLDDEVIQALQSDLVRAEKRSGATWYELTHDRLVEPILADNKVWFEQNASVLQRQAKLWNDQARNVNLLLRDQALLDAVQWAKEHEDELREYEKDFIKASQEWQDQLEKRQVIERMKLEQAEQEARSATRARRLTRFAFALLGLALIAVGFAVSGYVRASNNEKQLRNAQEEVNAEAARANKLANTALARELASQAEENLDKKLDLALLLGLEAYNQNSQTPDAEIIPQVEGILFDSVQSTLRMRGYLAGSEDPTRQLAYSPDGQHIALLQSEGIVLWDIRQSMTREVIPGTEFVEKYFFSPDGSRLIYLDHGGVKFWDVENSRILNETPVNGHKGIVEQVIFSSDGGSFATVGESGDVIVWDANLRSPIFTPLNVKTYAFSLDGNKFAVLDLDGNVTIYGMTDVRAQGASISADPHSTSSLAFNRTGNVLAIGDSNGTVVLWDLANFKEVESLSASAEEIDRLVFSAKDSFLVYAAANSVGTWSFENPGRPDDTIAIMDRFIASPDGTLFAVIDLATEQIFLHDIPEREQPRRPIDGTSCVFSPDGTMLAIFRESDGSLNLIKTSTGDPIGDPFTGKLDAPIEMAFSRDGSLLAIASDGGTVQVRKVSDWSLEFQHTVAGRSVSVMTFSPDGKSLLEGSEDGSLVFWEMEGNSIRKMETGYQGRISSMALSPDGLYVYTEANDGVVLVGTDTMQKVGGVFPNGYPVFSPDEDFLATIDSSAQTSGCSLWALPSGRKIAGGIQCSDAEFSPTGDRLASTYSDDEFSPTTTLWNTSDGRPVGTPTAGALLYFTAYGQRALILDPAPGTITLLDISTGSPIGEPISASYANLSSQGNAAALTDQSGNLITLDTDTGEVTGTLTGHTFVGFSPNGKVLISQDYYAGSISFNHIATQEPIGDPIVGVIGTSISPNGRRIAIMTYSGTGLWDTATGKRVDGFSIPESVSRFEFSPDGQYAITSDYYGSYTSLWNMATGERIVQGVSQTFLAFSPDGKYLLLRDTSTLTFSLWDVATGKDVGGGLAGHAGSFGGGLLNASDDEQVAIEDNVFNYRGQSVGDINFGQSIFVLSPDEETYAALSATDGSVSVWNVQSAPSIPGEEIGELEEALYTAVLSPDGHTMAVSTQEGMKLLDAATASEIGAFPDAHTRLPIRVELSPNGKFMAIFYSDDSTSLSVWDIDKNELAINSIEEEFYSFSPDGSRLITYPAYQTYTLWDTTTGKTIGEQLTGGDSLQFSRDGKYIVLYSYYGGTITIFDASTGAQFGEGIDGSFLWIGPGDHSIVVYDATSVKLMDIGDEMDVRSSIPNDGTTYFRLSQNGRYLAVLGSASPVLWDLEAEKQIGEINDFSGEFRDFSPQGQFVSFYSYEEGGYVLFETTEPNDRIGEDPIPGDYLNFSPDDELIVPSYYYYGIGTPILTPYSTSTGEKLDQTIRGSLQGFANQTGLMVTMRDEKNVYLWSTEDFTEPLDVIEYPGVYQGTVLSEDGNTLALYGSAGVMVMDISSPDRPTKLIKETTGLAQRMVFSPDGKILATIGSDGLILWDVESRTQLGETITRDDSYVADVKFSPKGDRVVYMDGLGNAFEIDLTNSNGINDPRKLSLPTNSCAIGFNAENHLLVVKQTLDQLLIENMDTDEMTQLKEGSCGNAMAFSQDGRSFAYSAGNRTFIFTPDHEQGRPFVRPTEIIGDQDYYYELTFVVDGSLLAMSGTDGHVQFWDIGSRSLVFEPQQSAELSSVSDGVALFYLPAENRLVSLDFKPDSLLETFVTWKAELCGKAGRNFTISESQQYFPEEEYRRTCEEWPNGE